MFLVLFIVFIVVASITVVVVLVATGVITNGNSNTTLLGPTNLDTGLITTTSAVLTWTASTNADSYDVSYKLSSSTEWTEFKNTTSTNVTVTGLTSNTDYDFSVVSVNSTGRSSPATLTNVKTALPPPSPTGFKVDAIALRLVELSWDLVPNINGYIVSYQIDTTDLWISNAMITTTNTVVDELEPGTTYNFKVVSVSSLGQSDPATIETITTGILANAPTNLVTQNITTSSVSLTWNVIENANSYSVSYQVAGTTNWILFNDVSINNTTVTGLTSNTNYNFKVVSNNIYGPSTPTLLNGIRTKLLPITNLISSNVTSNSVTLNYNGSLGAEEYEIFYKASSSSTFILFGTVTVTTSIVTGLSSNSTYDFQVVAKNTYGSSSPVLLNGILTSLSSPTNLISSSITHNYVGLSWNNVSGALNYEVSYKGSGDMNWILFTTTASSTTIVTGLLNNSTYSFKVVAMNGVRSSQPTTLDGILTSLSSPQNIEVDTITATSLNLTWNPVLGSTSYDIFFKLSNELGWSLYDNVASNSLIVSGLTSNTEYDFKIIAKDGIRVSEESLLNSVRTLLSSPLNLVTTNITSNSVSLTYNNVVGADSYDIFYKLSTDVSWSLFSNINVNNVTVTGLTSNTEYDFQVVAINSYSSSNGTVLDSVVTSLSSPTNLVASTITSNSVTLTYNNVVGGDSYDIFYKLSTDISWTLFSNINVNNVTVTGLTSNTEYDFQVVAINSYSSSSPTTIHNIKTILSAPTNLVGNTITANSVSLSWNQSQGVDSYDIFYKLSTNINWTLFNNVNVNNVTVTGLTSNTEYDFQVIAINSYSSSLPVTLSSILTLLEGPTSIITNTVDEESVSLSWSSVVGAVDYDFFYKLSIDINWILFTTTTSLSTTVIGLTSNTNYDFRVIATDGVRSSQPTLLTDIRTKLKPITNLLSDNVTSTNVTLNYNGSSGAEEYDIFYEVVNSSSFILFTTTSNTNITVTGLSSNTNYNFKVVAKNTYGDSSPVLLNGIVTLLSIPNNLTVVNVTTNSISLVYDTVTDATNYNIFYKQSSSSSFILFTTTSNTSITVTGLLNNTSYDFQVLASTTNNESSPATLNGILTSLLQPTGFNYDVVTASSVNLVWNTVDGAIEYDISYKVSTDMNWSLFTTTSSLTTTVTGLTSNTNYDFKVVATSTNNTSSPATLNDILTSISAPINLLSSTSTDTSIDLTWDTSSGATLYDVSYKLSSNTTWIPFTTTSTTNTSVTGLLDYTLYDFKVIAKDNTRTSVPAILEHILTSLSAPTNLSAGTITSSTIALTWNTVLNADNYTIKYKITGDSNWTVFTTTTNTNETLTGLVNNTEYNVQVLANSPYGSSVPATLNSLRTIISSPTNLSSSYITSSSIVLSWNPVEGSTGYYVYFVTSIGGVFGYSFYISNTIVLIPGLESNTEYNFNVAAVGPYNTSTGTWLNNVRSLPKAVTNLTSSNVTDTSVQLSWGSSPDAAQYYIKFKLTTDITWSIFSPTLNTTKTVTGLVSNTEYDFQVIAVSNIGIESEPVVLSTIRTRLSAPTNLVASTRTASSVSLTWNSMYGAASYDIFYKLSTDANWTLFNNVNTNGVTVTGVLNNTEYDFKAISINSYNSSEPSTLNNVRTILSSTDNVYVTTITSTSINLHWNSVVGAINYDAYYKASSNSSWILLDTTSNTSLTVSGLAGNTEYDFQIVSKNNYSSSSPTILNSIRTLLSSVTGLTVSNITANSLQLSWNSVEGASGYSTFYKIDGSSNWIPFSNVNTNNVLITDLTSGSLYDFQVLAWNAYGSSEPTMLNAIRTLLDQPINLTPTLILGTSVAFQWSSVVSATEYITSYKRSIDSVWTSYQTVTGTNVTVTGLSTGTSYDFRVVASNTHVTSNPAYLNNITTIALPGAVTGLTISNITLNGATLAWNQSSNTTSYDVSYSLAGQNNWNYLDNVTVTTFTVSTLPSGTYFDFKVTSLNAAGYGNPDIVTNIRTGALPSIPTNFNANVIVDQITLSWSPSTDADGYILKGQYVGDTTWQPLTVNDVYYIYSTAYGGRSYNFQVIAYNSYGNSDPAYLYNITSLGVPNQPIDIHVTNTTFESFTLEWSAVSSAVDYTISYQVNNSGNWVTFTTTSSLSCTITGLQASTTYDYKITGNNEYGSSSPYIVFQGTTTSPLPLPAQPTGLNMISTSPTEFQGISNFWISWNAVAYASSYNVYLDYGSSWFLAANVTETNYYGLISNNGSIAIEAVNSSGVSSWAIYTVSL